MDFWNGAWYRTDYFEVTCTAASDGDFSVGIVSALVAVWVPELMLLVMQAAFLRDILVVVARILDWIISGPRIQTTAIQRGNYAQDTNSEAIALLKLDSSRATVEKEKKLDDSQQREA